MAEQNLKNRTSNLIQKPRCVKEVIGFTVELDGIDSFVLVEQVTGIFGQQRINVTQLILPGQLYGSVPLTECHTAVHRVLDPVALLQYTQQFIASMTEIL